MYDKGGSKSLSRESTNKKSVEQGMIEQDLQNIWCNTGCYFQKYFAKKINPPSFVSFFVAYYDFFIAFIILIWKEKILR